MKFKEFIPAIIFAILVLLGLTIVVLTTGALSDDQAKVGEAIGVKNVFIDQRGLSDDTLKIVEVLRWKHYGHGVCLYSIDVNDIVLVNDGDFDYEWWSFYFEDGNLFVNTQDGKWVIEMKKVLE